MAESESFADGKCVYINAKPETFENFFGLCSERVAKYFRLFAVFIIALG